jgi:hypothetical protein
MELHIWHVKELLVQVGPILKKHISDSLRTLTCSPPFHSSSHLLVPPSRAQKEFLPILLALVSLQVLPLKENWKKTTTICNYILVAKDI